MCLYPRLIENGKFKPNKKNGGQPPLIKDHRTRFVPIGCQTCIECRRQKAREWQTRLQEDIKKYTNGKFITLTFSTESLKKIINDSSEEETEKRKKPIRGGTQPKKSPVDLTKLQGYDLDNAIATKAVRLFLERWRKKYKKSLRHWLITELGHAGTEHLHIHSIIWTDHLDDVKNVWQYGFVWIGNMKNGKRENYVNARTVNYITKYVTKMDAKHLNYKPIILTSAGIGGNYDGKNNRYNGEDTKEYYRTSTGHKMAMPVYWRNKIYTDDEREQLQLYQLFYPAIL